MNLALDENNSNSRFGVTWSPDGKFIASWRYYVVNIWNVATGKIHYTYDLLYQPSAVAWSPNNQYIAIVLRDDNNTAWQVKVWNAADNSLRSVYNGIYSEGNVAISWSPNSKYVAFADGNNGVQVIDPATGNLYATYGDTLTYDVAWSQNGRYLASCTRDPGGFQVWSVPDGNLRSASSSGWWHMSWSPDSRHIAVGGDNIVLIWQPF